MNGFKLMRASLLSFVLSITATSVAAEEVDGSIVDALVAIDGMQALVAAVLVVDDSGALDVSVAEALSTINNIILFAPTNPAFEALLGLEPGFLDGLSIDQIKEALPSVIDGLGLAVDDVISILLLHVGVIEGLDETNASGSALLAAGGVTVAGSEAPLPVSLGSKGVRVNYEASVVKSDVFTNNGVIHFIDSVIVDDLLAP